MSRLLDFAVNFIFMFVASFYSYGSDENAIIKALISGLVFAGAFTLLYDKTRGFKKFNINSLLLSAVQFALLFFAFFWVFDFDQNSIVKALVVSLIFTVAFSAVDYIKQNKKSKK